MQRTVPLLKKNWTDYPGRRTRGAKNLAWNPKVPKGVVETYFPINLEFPGRRPNSWHALEFHRHGLKVWPKEVGFYNSGDNFELTPTATFRVFEQCKDEPFWTQSHNEKTIIALMPIVEKDPQNMQLVDAVFQHHVKRFGADHACYNAVMQACAFAGHLERCQQLFDEMVRIHLIPDGQSFVNMMLAKKLAGEPKEKIEAVFKEAVRVGALTAVMRLDTEFAMWYDMLTRLGSFTGNQGAAAKDPETMARLSVSQTPPEGGYLSVVEEGAKPMPTDMWATWGWDSVVERKFVPRSERVHHEVLRRLGGGRDLYGSVYSKVKRRPWTRYTGMLLHDWKGPKTGTIPPSFPSAPPAEFAKTTCNPAF